MGLGEISGSGALTRCGQGAALAPDRKTDGRNSGLREAAQGPGPRDSKGVKGALVRSSHSFLPAACPGDVSRCQGVKVTVEGERTALTRSNILSSWTMRQTLECGCGHRLHDTLHFVNPLERSMICFRNPRTIPRMLCPLPFAQLSPSSGRAHPAVNRVPAAVNINFKILRSRFLMFSKSQPFFVSMPVSSADTLLSIKVDSPCPGQCLTNTHMPPSFPPTKGRA